MKGTDKAIIPLDLRRLKSYSSKKHTHLLIISIMCKLYLPGDSPRSVDSDNTEMLLKPPAMDKAPSCGRHLEFSDDESEEFNETNKPRFVNGTGRMSEDVAVSWDLDWLETIGRSLSFAIEVFSCLHGVIGL